MVKKKVTKKTKKVEKVVEEEGGMSLDDAFGDDEDVSYAESKPRKVKKKIDEDIEEELDEIEHMENHAVDFDRSDVEIRQSKAVSKVKKGDIVKIDGKSYEVDAHYVLMDHGTTKEMALEVFDDKNDKDYQIRYFDDQVESTLELYELQEILYVKRPFKKIEW